MPLLAGLLPRQRWRGCSGANANAEQHAGVHIENIAAE
jgi:hypothetical protein